MSKLRETVAVRNRLRKVIGELSLSAAITANKNLIDSIVDSYSSELVGEVKKISNRYRDLENLNQNTIKELNAVIKKLENNIRTLGESQFRSQQYFDQFSTSSYLQKQKLLGSMFTAEISIKIKSLSDWHYPGMVLNPRSKSYTDCLVTNDPLYVVDYDPDLVAEQLIAKYPQKYQQRLRLYPYQNLDFSQLPQGQFGLILVWDFFNYIALPELELYIKQLQSLLRPGGSLVFSFNNCDHPNSVKLAEIETFSYASELTLNDLARRCKFGSVEYVDYATNNAVIEFVSWAIFTAPGTLNTLKAHQALGQPRLEKTP